TAERAGVAENRYEPLATLHPDEEKTAERAEVAENRYLCDLCELRGFFRSFFRLHRTRQGTAPGADHRDDFSFKREQVVCHSPSSIHRGRKNRRARGGR